MDKYRHIFLKLKGKSILNLKKLDDIDLGALSSTNVVYIYRDSKRKTFYIGQTYNFMGRHNQHYNGTEERFIDNDFDEVIVIYSRLFNGSALDDVESQLITYLVTDVNTTRSNFIMYEDSVLNLTRGNNVNDYIEKEEVSTEIIYPFWKNVLYKKGWVSTESLDDLKNDILVKYSPIKRLTEEQREIINHITSSDDSFVINGDAGTGKTILLTHLVAEYITNYKNKNIAVVVPTNWKGTAEEIFKVFGYNKEQLDIGSSMQIINKKKKYDVIIVDESHKISRKGNKQHPTLNAVYEDEYEDYENHLQILKSIGKQVILMYDILQEIRPAHINREDYKRETKSFVKKHLSVQFRIQTPEGKTYTSNDYINGIKYLLYKDTGILDDPDYNIAYDKNFNRGVFQDMSESSYFGIFEDKPLSKSIEWISKYNNRYPSHMNRILGGLVEDWKIADGKDETKFHWKEDDKKLRWNETQDDWLTIKGSEDQVGSVFAVQGVDLNRVTVLMGKDLMVDEQGRLYAEPKNFKNTNGKFTKEEMEAKREDFTLLVLNIYYVLLTRGIDGVRVGFWDNPELKEYFKKVLLETN